VLKRLPIRLKLILLAGVPVIGALILATLIARDARRQAESAAALGSIEDLARLSAQMSGLVHALQFERNSLSLHMAKKTLEAPELTTRFAETDAARRQLGDFLQARKVSSLPPRLARDLNKAQEKLGAIQAERTRALTGTQPIDELLGYYEETDLTLISATAALSQLADDGELMRAISALVTLLQIKERASQEHALLSHVFALNEFPAGTYKDLVALITEEADYENVLSVNATDAVNRRFQSIALEPEFARTAALRKVALDTTGDDFATNPEEWSAEQGKKVEAFRRMEVALNDAVKVAALAKVSAAARAVRVSYTLGGSVIVLSALLAGLIASGISRSVASLAKAAEHVRKEKDFSVRATKTSDDELGRLTDAFNEMLSGIQKRDEELRHHRENLEQLVEQRTAALQKRNESMRLVLDNVEQGLATIEPDGKVSSERSAAFDTWFGGKTEHPSFADHLASSNEHVRASLLMGWEQVVEGFLPVEVAVDQMPRQIEVAGRYYNLTYKAIVEKDNLQGALLVVSDVTDEMERLRRDAEQRELISVFERVMRDRAGFIEFFKECEGLVQKVVSGEITEPGLVMRAVHTVKGNCGIFGIGSVAGVAHRLESFVVESGALPSAAQCAELATSWQAFAERVRRLSGSEEEPVVEVAYEELSELEAATRARVPHAALGEMLQRLKYERGVVRLRRIAEQAKSLAERLGKGELNVVIDASPDVRFQAEHWAPFWSAFVHVVRNALDHGVEASEARLAAGKSKQATLRLAATSDAKLLNIEIADDGRGIDWDRVREKCKERGLPHGSDKDLVDALFSDGLSTADGVTAVSGRGVGMGATRDAAQALGGSVSVVSKRGEGTTISFRFPLAEATRVSPTSIYPGARPSIAPPPPPRPGKSKTSSAA